MIIRQIEEHPLTGSLKSHPSLPSQQAQKLIPTLQLPRSCLPLAYLDPLGGPDDLPGGTFFSAHIQVLEKIMHEDRRSNQPTVLIAQSTIDNRLFAIECIQEEIYALCRLGSWVSVNTLERLQTVPIDIVRPQKRQRQEQPGLPGDKWWSTAAIDFRPENRYVQGKNSGVEKTRGVQLCLQTAQQKSATPARVTEEISQPISQAQTENMSTNTMEGAAQDLEEVLKMVKAQYQEALYATKVRISFCTSFGPFTDCSSVIVGILCKRAIVSSPGCLLRLQWLCHKSRASYFIPEILHSVTRYY